MIWIRDRLSGPRIISRKIQQLDHIKREVCRKLGLAYLEIPYWDLANVDTLVTDFVKSLGG